MADTLCISTALPTTTARAFYDDLTDAMADAPYPPGWRKGVYPTQAFLDASIAHGELFLAELDGVLAGCMVQYAIGTARSGLPRAVARRAGRQRPGRAALHRAGLCPPRHGADVL